MTERDATTADPFDRIRSARFVLLTTFRRDGTPVPTPVWAVPVETAEGRGIRIWTQRSTGKVKRIRNGAKVELTPCTARGAPRGETVQAEARLLDRAGTEETLNGLRSKYGLLARLLTVRANRRLNDAIGIEAVERR